MKYFLKNGLKNETDYTEVTLAELKDHVFYYNNLNDCCPVCLTKATRNAMYFEIEVYEC